jgi:hypothetical protein
MKFSITVKICSVFELEAETADDAADQVRDLDFDDMFELNQLEICDIRLKAHNFKIHAPTPYSGPPAAKTAYVPPRLKSGASHTSRRAYLKYLEEMEEREKNGEMQHPEF